MDVKISLKNFVDQAMELSDVFLQPSSLVSWALFQLNLFATLQAPLEPLKVLHHGFEESTSVRYRTHNDLRYSDSARAHFMEEGFKQLSVAVQDVYLTLLGEYVHGYKDGPPDLGAVLNRRWKTLCRAYGRAKGATCARSEHPFSRMVEAQKEFKSKWQGVVESDALTEWNPQDEYLPQHGD